MPSYDSYDYNANPERLPGPIGRTHQPFASLSSSSSCRVMVRVNCTQASAEAGSSDVSVTVDCGLLQALLDAQETRIDQLVRNAADYSCMIKPARRIRYERPAQKLSPLLDAPQQSPLCTCQQILTPSQAQKGISQHTPFLHLVALTFNTGTLHQHHRRGRCPF